VFTGLHIYGQHVTFLVHCSRVDISRQQFFSFLLTSALVNDTEWRLIIRDRLDNTSTIGDGSLSLSFSPTVAQRPTPADTCFHAPCHILFPPFPFTANNRPGEGVRRHGCRRKKGWKHPVRRDSVSVLIYKNLPRTPNPPFQVWPHPRLWLS